MGLFNWLWPEPDFDRCRVILHNSSHHSYEYVIRMLGRVCGLPVRAGYELAKQVDQTGRAEVFTGTWEACERVRREICEYGPDSDVQSSTRSMLAEVVQC
jgi:ATP-dependent Clp protease adapter protein ClpS